MAWLKLLRTNNVGPSASTGKLAPEVDKGELHVATREDIKATDANAAELTQLPDGVGIFEPAGTTSAPARTVTSTPASRPGATERALTFRPAARSA